MKPHTEVEAKLCAPGPAAFQDAARAAAELGWRLEPLGESIHRDTYYDTPGWREWRVGFACRLREIGERRVWCRKALAPLVGGVARREETEHELGPREQPAKELRPLFTLTQRRRTARLAIGDDFEAEWSADAVAWPGGVLEAELEIELVRGEPEQLERAVAALQERLGWPRSTASKFERGIALAGLLPPERG